MPKIFMHKYTALSGYEVAKEIIKLMKNSYSPLTKDQEQALRSELGNNGILGNLDMPFQAYKWKENYPTGRNSLWRLSVVFYIIAILFTYPFIFGYWCVSGKFNLPRKWKFTKLIIKWNQNIFE